MPRATSDRPAAVLALPAALLVAASLVAAACGASPAADDRAEDAATTTEEHTTAPSSDREAYLVERTTAEGREVVLARQKPNDALFPSYGTRGKLVVDERGCLRIKLGNEDYVPAPIWPPGFGLSTEGGEIRVLDDKGKVVARVGDRVDVGGSGKRSLEGLITVSERLQRKLPERCPGPYWIIGPPVRGLDRRG